MGDHFFVDRFPFADIDNGGNAVGLMRNVGRILQEVSADVRIILGHGPLTDVDDLRRYHMMLEETLDLVRQKKSGGQTLEQIQEAGVPLKYESWGAGFIDADRWLEIVFRSLG